jgi:hypothetical protein
MCADGVCREGFAMSRVLLLLTIGALTVSTLLLRGQDTTAASAATLMPAAAQSQEPPASPQWQTVGLRGPIWNVSTPASGALLARTPESLVRLVGDNPWNLSHWQTVSLPAHTLDERYWSVVVDPTNHDIVYASAAGGLFKTTDGGQSWTLLLPTDEYALRLAISPANTSIVYAGLGQAGSPANFKFLRSKDGGATWEQLERHQNMTCFWVVPILLPHPMDEQQLFRAGGCLAGRDFYDQLLRSSDQGASWRTAFGVGRPGASSRDSQHPEFAYPTILIGNQGVMPARTYLATRRDQRVGDGASLFRSDDDAQTWTEVFASRPATEPDGVQVRIGGLAYNPSQPDTVYLGLNVSTLPETSDPPTFLRAGVLVSTDAGQTWQPLGRQDLPRIHQLALGLDGRNLFAASSDGLWRLKLD